MLRVLFNHIRPAIPHFMQTQILLDFHQPTIVQSNAITEGKAKAYKKVRTTSVLTQLGFSGGNLPYTQLRVLYT